MRTDFSRGGSPTELVSLTSDAPARSSYSWSAAARVGKATELSDFSVCTTWGVSGKDLFLLGLFRRRLEYPALKRELQSLFDANEVLIGELTTRSIGALLAFDTNHAHFPGKTMHQPKTGAAACMILVTPSIITFEAADPL